MPRKSRTRELFCLACPLGCVLTVRTKGGELRSVTGNRCRKGIAFAEAELASPRRLVTTTVRLEGGRIGLLPVKTSTPVPRDLAPDVVRAASRVMRRAPVRLGDTVIANVCGTGADLVATRSCGTAADEEDA